MTRTILILLMLLSVTAFSQDVVPFKQGMTLMPGQTAVVRLNMRPVLSQGKSTYIVSNDGVDSILAGMDRAYLETTLRFYAAYERECWNDSTAIYHYEGGVGHRCLVLNCPQEWDTPPVKVFSRWEHTEPTFEGFIDFLRRRVKP